MSILTELLESVQYGVLLTEAARTEFLLKTYGERIAAKYEAERNTTPAAVAHEIEGEPGDNEAAKVLTYILSHDPTRNQAYTQWMCNKYLKGQLKLEDLPRAAQYLAVFDQAKKQLPQKDINGYKDMAALRAAVEPFLGHQSVQAANDDREGRRHRQDDQAEVLLRTPEFELIKILTKQAACYFGRNTEWCTAWGDPKGRHPTRSNRYDSYAPQGPLYVFMTPDGQKPLYQWHFPSDQFLNVNDEEMRSPTFVQFVQQHPEVIKAIGEQNFADVAARIGLQYFSPRMAAQIDMRKMVHQIDNLAAFKGLPPDYQTNQDFIYELATYRHQNLEWLPPENIKPETYMRILERAPAAYKSIPEAVRTPVMAEAAASRLEYHAIKWNIPQKEWTPAIHQRVWDGQSENSQFELKNVPEQYRSQTVYLNMIRHKPEITQKVPEAMWNQEFAHAVVEKNPKAAPFIPVPYIDHEILDAVYNKYKDGYDKQAWAVFSRVPVEMLNVEMIKYLIDKGELPYAKLPENMRGETAVVEKLLKRKPEQFRAIPDEMITPALVTFFVHEHPEKVGMVKPGFLTNETLLPAINQNYFYGRDTLYQKLPKSALTPEVIEAFMRHNLVPVKRMPPALRTPQAVVARVTQARLGNYMSDRDKQTREQYLGELKDVPKPMWTPEFCALLVRADHDILDRLPESLIQHQPVLHAYLDRHKEYSGSSHGDHQKKVEMGKKGFARFSKDIHTPQAMVRALETHLIEPKVANIDPKLLTPAVAAHVLILDAAEWKNLPDPLKLDDRVLVATVQRNFRILNEIPTEQIPLVVAYAAVKQWAHSAGNRRWSHNETYGLDRLDRSQWPEKIWEQAIGYIATLKDLPPKMRTPAMVQLAVNRNPVNLRYLKDAAAYITDNKLTLPENKEVQSEWEDNGVLIKKGKIENASDLPQQKCEGGSFAMVPLGPQNRKLYVFDAKGKCVARLVTKDGKVTLPMGAEAAKPYQKLILSASQVLSHFNAGDLEALGIYDGRRGFETHDMAERTKVGGLEWGKNNKGKGAIFTGYLNNKPIITLTTDMSNGSWGRRANLTLQRIEYLDKAACFANRGDIFKYITDHMPDGYNSLEEIGAVNLKNGQKKLMVADKLLGTDGDLAGYTDADGGYICVCDKEGILVWATRRKSGKLDHVKWEHRVEYGDDEEARRGLKNRAEQALMHFAAGGGTVKAEPKAKAGEPKTAETPAQGGGDLFSQPAAQAPAASARAAGGRRRPPEQLDLFR